MSSGQALFAQAFTHHQQGRLAEAEALYRRLLVEDGRHPGALHLLGVIALQIGRSDLALLLIARAIGVDADEAVYHSHRGNALVNLGRPADAIAAYRTAILLQPDHADAYYNLGIALSAAGRLADAVAACGAAILLKPDFADTHYNQGNALAALGRLGAAVAAYDAALDAQPDHVLAHCNRGNALKEMGRLDQAVAAFEAAIRHKPDFAEAHSNLGTVLTDLGRPGDALAAFEAALAIRPDYAEAYSNQGSALKDLGRLDAAIAAFRTAIRLNPDCPGVDFRLLYCLQHACAWERMMPLAGRMREGIPPFLLLALDSSAEQQLAAAAAWASVQRQNIEPLPARPAAKRERLRLGYLSGDFRDHPVAHLLVELIELHDRRSFEVIGYSYGPDDNSATRQRLAKGFDRFVDIRPLAHADAARIIRQDEIDILVDLAGYTAGARPQILAYRPAPLQVNFLGYPGSMGADFIDYVIADKVCIPPGDDIFYRETVLRLPDCYQPNDRRRAIAAQTPARETVGLPERGMVFCCFNNGFKITPAVFAVWVRLLHRVPGGVLWLLEANSSLKGNLRRHAALAGIDPDRLIFAPRLPLPEHLARHRLADLFLDTLPYNAHTTASDALWAGLPVLTCRGGTFPGRVAASLLSAIGMEELVTASLAEYEDLALALAHDPARLEGLKRKLAAGRSTAPLFDSPRFARNLEAAYQDIWRRHFPTAVAAW